MSAAGISGIGEHNECKGGGTGWARSRMCPPIEQVMGVGQRPVDGALTADLGAEGGSPLVGANGRC